MTSIHKVKTLLFLMFVSATLLLASSCTKAEDVDSLSLPALPLSSEHVSQSLAE